jgi:hypothetical protein
MFDLSAVPADGDTMFELNGNTFVCRTVVALPIYIRKDKIPFLSPVTGYRFRPYSKARTCVVDIVSERYYRG